MSIDPVCGMQVNEQDAAAHGLISHFEQVPYYFCCEHCKRQFDQQPQLYLERQPMKS